MYLCHKRKFKTLDEAKAYAQLIWERKGWVVAIEEVK